MVKKENLIREKLQKAIESVPAATSDDVVTEHQPFGFKLNAIWLKQVLDNLETLLKKE